MKIKRELEPDWVNKAYTYTTNNPVKYIDPSGHMFIDDDRTSCQTAKCLQDEYYYGKEDQDKLDTLLEKERKWREEHQSESDGLMPSVSSIIDTKKFGVGGLDYGFFESKPDVFNYNGITSVLEAGDYAKQWKLPLISQVLTATEQIYNDKDKEYPFVTKINRVLIAVSVDFTIGLIPLGAALGITAATSGLGPASIYYGAVT